MNAINWQLDLYNLENVVKNRIQNVHASLLQTETLVRV